MKDKILIIGITFILMCSGVFILPGFSINNESINNGDRFLPTTNQDKNYSRAPRPADMNNDSNDFGPVITDSTHLAPKYPNNGSAWILFNVSVYDDDVPNDYNMTYFGTNITAVWVNVTEFGIPFDRDMIFLGNFSEPTGIYNDSRGEGWYEYNFTIPPALEAGDYNATVHAVDSGFVNVFESYIIIQIRVFQYNRPPVFNASHSFAFTFLEDEYNTDPLEIDYNDLFFDPDVSDGPFNNTPLDALTFRFWFDNNWLGPYAVRDFGNFTIQFNGTDGLHIFSKLNLYTESIGERINLSAKDGFGRIVEYMLTITINSVNDLPIINGAFKWEILTPDNVTMLNPSTIQLTQRKYAEMNVTGIDFDGDTLFFAIEGFNKNTTALETVPFIIDEPSGNLHFIPNNDAVGTFHVNISVRDAQGDVAQDWLTFNFEVKNENDPPEIFEVIVNDAPQPITDHFVTLDATQDQNYSLLIKVKDPDVVRGLDDQFLIFAAEPLVGNIHPEVNKITNTSAFFTFTPNNADVGYAQINFSVFDGWEFDYVIANFTIINVNDPPIIREVDGRQIIEIGKLVDLTERPLTDGEMNFTFRIWAEDMDFETPEGEVLSWDIIPDSFPMDTYNIIKSDENRSAEIQLFGEKMTNGIYTLNITVTDDEEFSDFVLVRIEVNITEIIPPPENNEPQLLNGGMEPTSGDTDTEFTFYVTYTDSDGDLPSSIQVVIDGVIYDMTLRPGENATNGIYEYKMKLSKGNHTYYFMASDGKAAAVGGTNVPTSEANSVATPTISEPTAKEDKGDEMNWLLYIILIVIVIIILLVLALVVTRRKPAREPAERVEEEEIEDWEPMPEEAEGEFAGEEEMGEVGLGEKMPAKGAVPGEIVSDEELFEDIELAKPAKGKLPEEFVEPEGFEEEEIPKKGELPEPEMEEPELVPEGEPMAQVVRLEEKSIPCGICLGTIKAGLLTIKCRCGKYYHDTCGIRLGECPRCDLKFDKEQLKMALEAAQAPTEEDFSDMTEFQEPFKEAEPTKPAGKTPKGELSPMEILKGRLAKGEIDLKTYNKLKKELE